MSDNKELIAAWVKARNDPANILFESSLEIHVTDEPDLSDIKIGPDAMRLADFEKRRAQPALTAEEWKEGEFDSRYGACRTSLHVDHKGRMFVSSDMLSPSFESASDDVIILNEWENSAALHKTAALCLNGQPFGFTREDVAVLREAAWAFGSMHSEVDQSAAELRVASIADRIEALLPPEST